ncbi:MAG: NACHT domain-containing protein [Armatimonadota bacterium]
MQQQNASAIDIGFVRLQETVEAIPEQLRIAEAREVVEGLRLDYTARLAEPIIPDSDHPEHDPSALCFPAISKAFIPQAYRVLRYTDRKQSLGQEESWQTLKEKDDLNAFLLCFLSSPFSVETPLLILGHPGSGKSLLTKVLCGRLCTDAFTPIRVPLRDVNASDTLDDQILGEIRRRTGTHVGSWAGFSRQFAMQPLVIILDGYDELLQASGQVYASYLAEVQKFQQREAEQGRPVRVIVTSRVTLIDKAIIPMGSTILRLLKFDRQRQQAWVDVWNQTNATYFSTHTIQPFAVPTEAKLRELAEQPLLILLLALYDSEDNSLNTEARRHRIDRTELYDKLLRRFIIRQHRKDGDFDTMEETEQKETIEREMMQLGIAALGMYNRRQLDIQATELENDLEFFGLKIPPVTTTNRPLTQAEMLMGRFFFIHHAHAEDREGVGDAFEFLHNTFGEFLTADLLLRHTYAVVEEFDGRHRRHTRLMTTNDPITLSRSWYACLMYAPLHDRPVVLEMLREWYGHQLEALGLSRESFLACIDDLLRQELLSVLCSRRLPMLEQAYKAANTINLPLLGHLAIYTFNLILLRTTLTEGTFIFDEGDYTVGERDGASPTTRPWDRLTCLWRAWFTPEALKGLPGIFTVQREGTRVILGQCDPFFMPGSDRLTLIKHIAETLADNVTAGMAGMLTHDFGHNTWEALHEVEHRLRDEKIDLDFVHLVRYLRLHYLTGSATVKTIEHLVYKGFDHVNTQSPPHIQVVDFFTIVRQMIRSRQLSFDCKTKIKHKLSSVRYFHKVLSNFPEAVTEWLLLVRELADYKFFLLADPESFGGGLVSASFFQDAHSCPSMAVEWLRFFQEAYRLFHFDYNNFVVSVLESPHYNEMLRMHPEIALELLRLLQVDNQKQLNPRIIEFVIQLLQTTSFGRLYRECPSLAVEIIHLTKGIGDDKFFTDIVKPQIKRMTSRINFHQLLTPHPEVASKYLDLIREAGTGVCDDSTRTLIDMKGRRVEHFMNVMFIHVDVAIAWLRLLRALDERRWLELYGASFLRNALGSKLNELPLEVLEDLVWCANIVADIALLGDIRTYYTLEPAI